MSVETIARRYATALADVVIKSGETEPVKTELKSWEELFAAHADLYRAFSNPTIAHLSKENLLESLIAKTKPTKTASNFLRILLRNSRLTELRQINDKFAAVLDERGGIVGADITSARALSDAERAELGSSIEKLTGKQVKLNFIIDANIIGGVVTRVGSTVYDSSVKTQLENLKQQLVNG